MPEITATARAGRLIAGTLRRQVREICWRRNWTLQIEEDRAPLTILYRFTVTVPDRETREAAQVFADLSERWNAA